MVSYVKNILNRTTSLRQKEELTYEMLFFIDFVCPYLLPKAIRSPRDPVFWEILTYATPDNKEFVCRPGAHDILKHTIPKVLTYAPTRFMDFICHQAEKKAGPQSLQTRLFPCFSLF